MTAHAAPLDADAAPPPMALDASADAPVTVTGLVEAPAGAYLTGWAIDTERDTSCAIVVLNEADQVVASGLADRPRSDLAVYGFGRSDFAFRLPIPDLGQGGALRIIADGAELTGSPLPTGAGLWDGAVSVHDGWAEGWVHERRLGFDPPLVTLLDQDDVELGAGETVSGAGDALFHPARFRIRLHPAAWRREELALRATVDGTAFATTQTCLTLKGCLDEVELARCAGWLLCPEALSTRMRIEARRDGVLVGEATADQPRGDLRELYPTAWRSGFQITLTPPRLPDERPYCLSLRLAGCDTELFDGPFLIGPRGSFIGPAQRVATLAHSLTLDAVERSVLSQALAGYIAQCRAAFGAQDRTRAPVPAAPTARRFTVVIPVYRDVAITRACIDSVIATRNADTDPVVLVDDASPDLDMAELLASYAELPHVHVLTNQDNRGFVRSVNRALAFCRDGDVVLLNSDTRVFPGGLEELWSAAQSRPDIGTATALSNNATLFSYPITDQACAGLDDIGWDQAAAAALAANHGRVIDVPTGHGFCMLIKRALLNRLGGFDESFGRGYGEENDYCRRGADLGFRNVAAAGAFVEHRESVSFGAEKSALLSENLQRLEQRYPEYAAEVRDYLKRDDLRAARWGIDARRLRSAGAAGARFVLLLRNWLDGGTRKAMADIAAHTGHDGARPLDLWVDASGVMRLSCAAPDLCAVFAEGEQDALFAVLDAATITTVLIHQVLGFSAAFVTALRGWSRGRDAGFYLHDFYALCPRVTMIDAVGAFCNVAPVTVCARCVALAGAHDASRMTELTPAEHRALFADLLGGVTAVLAPSRDAAAYLTRGFPGIAATVAPHPEPPELYQVPPRAGGGHDVVLLGAIGPHKGSSKLLEVAQRAWLLAPELHFHVIGYTDIDATLRATGNVSVSGLYEPAELPDLVAATGARLALFLHRWPETFSYTLSEAVQLGLVPLVPDIGAPAERVRAAGYGHVFGFPIDPAEVVDLLVAIAAHRLDPTHGQTPAAFATVAA
jgi:GT2 family glycosyltransferase